MLNSNCLTSIQIINGNRFAIRSWSPEPAFGSSWNPVSWSPPQPQETAPQSWRRGQSRWMQSAGAEPDAEYAVPAGKAPAEGTNTAADVETILVWMRGLKLDLKRRGSMKTDRLGKARQEKIWSNWCIFMIGVWEGELMRRENK